MTLPSIFQNIFGQKNKSYKMVLILSFLDVINGEAHKRIPLQEIRQRFLDFIQKREAEGKPVDDFPQHIGKISWREANDKDIARMFQTPVDALNKVLYLDKANNTLQFHQDLIVNMNSETLKELRRYAEEELESYFNKQANNIPLRDHLITIMDGYLAARNESFSGHELASYMRQTIPREIHQLSFIHSDFKVQGSVGQGNWAKNPWIAILNKKITQSTQYGEYIVYLFSENMKSVYLTLAQGVTRPKQEKGKPKAYHYLEEKSEQLRSQLPLIGMQKDDQIYLSNDGLGRDYQVSTIAYIRYDRDQMPDNQQLISDLENAVKNYDTYVYSNENKKQNNQEQAIMKDTDVKKHINQIQAYIQQKGFTYPKHLIENFYLSLKSKPFVVLAGVSGTGKTKLVELFADAVGATQNNGRYTLISVRPDWSDPSDLLGYQDLSGAFRAGQLTHIFVEASRTENQHRPYFICLDEMNLARVEHYFSDLLSIMETQKWKDGQITSQELISADSLIREEDKKIYGGLTFPDNVYLIGTVNMDETTHPFSKKVLDRANTIEFNYIDLSQFPQSTTNDVGQLALSNDFFRVQYLQLVDVYHEHPDMIQQITDKLVHINRILEPIHSHVGFRIRDAVCFYMIYNHRFDLVSQNDAFDVQLLQKILPRVQGSHLAVKKVLLQLLDVCLVEKITADDHMDDALELVSRWDVGKNAPDATYPQSARKISYMLRRLEEDGFTSYWIT